ncbi:MAG TPA: hypothetical protein VGS79_05985 [Puia sp.]|nr:hypothetical protein [Puia sp.]
MNWKVITYLTLIAVVSGVFLSCYKTKNFSTNLTAQIDSAIIVQSYDQARVTAVLDEVFNDVNTALSNQNAVTGAGLLPDTTLCNATIQLDTSAALNVISINYIGASCDNSRNLNGNVTIYCNRGTSWSTANDTIGVNINKLTVQGVTDTNTIRLSGIFYVVNSSGNNLAALTAASTPVVHEIVASYLGVWFNSADTATWQVARKRSYTNSGSGFVITTTGIDTVAGIANVSEWGGNRYGNSFVTAIDTPLVATSACGYQVTSGQEQLTNPTGATNLSFGLNASGAAASGCPAAGSYYYFQFSWTGSDSNPYSSVRPYPFW